MPDFCCIIECGNRGDRDVGKRFFRIPKIRTKEGERTKEISQKRQEKWLSNIRRADIKTSGIESGYLRVCSDHFVSGGPSKLYDENSLDWAPTLKLGHAENVTPDSAAKRYQRHQQRDYRKRKLSESACLLQSLSKKTNVSSKPNNDITDSPLPLPKSNQRVRHVECQTDITMNDMLQMEIDATTLKEDAKKSNVELYELRQKVLDVEFNQLSFETSDEKTRFYTGLPNFTILLAVFELCSTFIKSTHRNILSKFQEFILVLMRLRLNLQLQDLAYRFHISQSTASRIFTKWIDVMSVRLNFLIIWPDREVLRETMPAEFCKSFGNRVSVIIDCFEIFIDRPSNLKARAQTWSSYKHHNTVKFLIGIAPQGGVSFISKGWGGRVSDKYLTEHCDLLQNLVNGDIVLADRGFDIADSVGYYCATLKIPAFTKGKSQLPALEVETTRKIAHVRIHVERVIGHVRRKYQVLQSTLPIEYLIKKSGDVETPIDKIVKICCALTNLCDSIVPME
ncbi:uncharacterized protein LOC144447095 [Glandiceps talaboti]